MPNAFPFWHISYCLFPLLKIIHQFRIPTQKSLVPSKSLKNHMEQVFGHKGKVMGQTRTNPEQSRTSPNSRGQSSSILLNFAQFCSRLLNIEHINY